MHILIGICLALGLLYAWLIGWWFARVLVFLELGVLGTIGGYGIGSQSDVVAGVLLGIGFVALGWVLASLPVYYWRQRLGLTVSEPTRLRQWINREFS